MTFTRMIATGCIITLAAVSWVSAASAQQKRQPARAQAPAQTALEQAWHECLQWVDRTAPRTGENDAQRTAQFKACMTERGYRR